MPSGATVSNVTIYPMLRDAEIADPTFEPHHPSVKQTLRDTEVIEGKNLNVYPYIVSSQTSNGVTLTVDDKGVININGTATEANTCVIHSRAGLTDDNPIILPAGNYAVTKDVTGGATVELVKTVSGSRTTIVMMGTGDVKKTFSLSETTQVGIVLGWENSTVFSNKKLGIMIVDSSETNLAFEPYYIPLKDSKFDRAEQNVLGAKNILPYPIGTRQVVSSAGVISNSPDMYLSDYIDTNGATDFTVSIASKVGEAYMRVAYYDSSKTFISRPVLDPISLGKLSADFTVPANTKYLRLCFEDDSEKFTNPMLRLASDPDDTYVPYAMTNRELTEFVKRTKLSGTDDLDTVFGYGDYYWENAYPAHTPENQTFGSMRVYPCGEIIHQEIIRASGVGALIYMRRYQNSWSNWYKFTGTVVS